MQKIKVLIVTLSHIKNEHNYEEVQKFVSDIDVNCLGKAKSWQMPLEAIKFHQDSLEFLIVLTSNESASQLPVFKNIVRQCFGEKIRMHSEEIDMNDIESIREGYHRILDIFKGYKDSQIVYDVTSGNKLSTAAGAFFALNNDRMIQYVDTHTYEVKMYNNKYIVD